MPNKAYEFPILETLYALGGRGQMKQVLVIVERKMKHLFSDVDYQPLSSGQDIRWKNTAQFARYALVKRGLIKDFESAGRGVWELTEQGIAEIENNKSG